MEVSREFYLFAFILNFQPYQYCLLLILFLHQSKLSLSTADASAGSSFIYDSRHTGSAITFGQQGPPVVPGISDINSKTIKSDTYTDSDQFRQGQIGSTRFGYVSTTQNYPISPTPFHLKSTPSTPIYYQYPTAQAKTLPNQIKPKPSSYKLQPVEKSEQSLMYNRLSKPPALTFSRAMTSHNYKPPTNIIDYYPSKMRNNHYDDYYYDDYYDDFYNNYYSDYYDDYYDNYDFEDTFFFKPKSSHKKRLYSTQASERFQNRNKYIEKIKAERRPQRPLSNYKATPDKRTEIETTTMIDTTTFAETTTLDDTTTEITTTEFETTTALETTTVPETTTLLETTTVPETTTVAETTTPSQEQIVSQITQLLEALRPADETVRTMNKIDYNFLFIITGSVEKRCDKSGKSERKISDKSNEQSCWRTERTKEKHK